ncbi:MAG: CPBP family intramembrane glutamic endopeptidase [Candidatus Acidiferrum sp.]
MRLKRLLAKPRITTVERLTLYGATIAFQWVAVAVVAWRAVVRGMTAEQLGLASHDTRKIIVVTLVGAVILGILHWFNLRRVGKVQAPQVELMRKIAERILPQSLLELLPYSALAVTAGICEEFLYRGFAMGALTRTGLNVWVVVIVTSLLFGLAHAYQGRGGIIGTMLLGFLFAGMRLAYDSLIPVMVWHAVVDVVAGLAGPRFLLRAEDLKA